MLNKWNPESWDIDPQALKAKIKELHKYMAKCEEIKYDAEQRLIAQEYDVSETWPLHERNHTFCAVERVERATASSVA